MQHVTALKSLNPLLADKSTEIYCLYLMEYEGKYLEKYLNTVIKYKLKNVYKYIV